MRRCYNLDLDPLITGEANMLTTRSDIGRLRRGPVENINPKPSKGNNRTGLKNCRKSIEGPACRARV